MRKFPIVKGEKVKKFRGKLVITMLCISCLMLSLSIVYAFQRQDVGSPVRIIYTAEKATGGEIWKADDKAFNKAEINYLLRTISGDSSVNINNMSKIQQMAEAKTTAAQMRAFNVNKAAGEDITVTLGGLKWTVTYLSTDSAGNPILTLWLCPFQDAWANKSSTEGQYYGFLNGALYSDWAANWYESGSQTKTYPSNMYGTSYIRAVTLNNGGTYATSSTATSSASQSTSSVFSLFTMSDGGLTKYLVKPSQVTWQEKGQSAKDQLKRSYNNSNENWSDKIPNDGFNQNGAFNYANKTGNDAWKDDYLWLPSLTETGYEDSHIGIWDLSTTQRFVSDQSSAGGNVGTASGNAYNWSWLRSGYYNYAGNAYLVSYNGFGYSGYNVNLSYAVRPALHLNLASAASAA